MRGRGRARVAERDHVPEHVVADHPALELVDEEVLGPAAAVAPDVDDEPLLVAEGAPELVELGDVVAAHGGDVHVADLAARRLGHLGDVVGEPAVVAQGVLGAHGLHLVGARGAVAAAAHRERDLLALGDLQVAVGVVRRLDVVPVDGEQDVALPDVDVRAGERGGELAVVVGGPVDLREAVAPARVGGEVRPEQPRVRRRLRRLLRPHVPAADVGVRHAQLPDHLGEQPVEVRARRQVRHERAVGVADLLPVVAVHPRVVEEVPVPAPGVVEDLGPLLVRPHPAGHALEVEPVAERPGGRHLERRADEIAAALLDDHLLAVRRQPPVRDRAVDRRLPAVGDVVHVERPGVPAGRREDLVELVVPERLARGPGDEAPAGLEVEVVARLDRNREGAAGEAVEVDAVGLAALLGRLVACLRLRRLLERRPLAGLQLDGHYLHRIGDDVVVLEGVEARIEVAIREEVHELAVGVERRVEAVVEPVRDRGGRAPLEVVEEDPVVAVLLDERVHDPLAVRRPGVVRHLPEELVVLEPVGGREPGEPPRRHVDVEQGEVLVAEEDLAAVGRPLEVVDGAVERGRELLGGLAAADLLDVELVLAGAVGEERHPLAVGRDLRHALADPRRVGEVARGRRVVRRHDEDDRRAPPAPRSCRRSRPTSTARTRSG